MISKKRKVRLNKSIRVYPTKNKVGWLISLGVWGRFTPQTEKEYLTLPAEAYEDVKNIKSIIVEIKQEVNK